MEILRGKEEWLRAGAYSVRIQGMNRQHHISLKEEFDDHDGSDTYYVILLEDGYPFATARFYEVDTKSVVLGRVVILPEYRGQGYGRMTVEAAEHYAAELGYHKILIDSRLEAVKFYEKLGYEHMGDTVLKSGNFDCVKMCKTV